MLDSRQNFRREERRGLLDRVGRVDPEDRAIRRRRLDPVDPEDRAGLDLDRVAPEGRDRRVFPEFHLRRVFRVAPEHRQKYHQ